MAPEREGAVQRGQVIAMALRFVVPLLFLVLCAVPARPAEAAAPVAIDIVSSWGSLNASGRVDIHIRRTSGAYTIDGKPADAQAVAALVAAIEAPAVHELDLANLGIDHAWIAQAAQMPSERLNFATAAPNQIALYRTAFQDEATLRDLLQRIYRSDHSDDFPQVRVTVTYDDKSVASAESMSQQAFMLPWSVTRNGQATRTYNANIGRAVGALLPEPDPNKPRADGAGLRGRLKLYFDLHIEGAWETLDAMNRAGSDMFRVKARYTVVDAAIENSEGAGTGTGIGEKALLLTLQSARLPDRFYDDVTLAYQGGAAQGLGPFLARMPRYERHVRAVPWLLQYVSGHPDAALRLSYDRSKSLDDATMVRFAADMHVLGKDALAAEVRAQQDAVVLLRMGSALHETLWLVLPDHRTVLWRARLPADVLERDIPKLPERHCADGFYLDRCMGFIIAKDGTVADATP